MSLYRQKYFAKNFDFCSLVKCLSPGNNLNFEFNSSQIYKVYSLLLIIYLTMHLSAVIIKCSLNVFRMIYASRYI